MPTHHTQTTPTFSSPTFSNHRSSLPKSYFPAFATVFAQLPIFGPAGLSGARVRHHLNFHYYNMTVAADPMVAAERQIVAEHQQREKVINEEFKIWKKTVPLLYDTIHTHALEWPLLLVAFLPQYTVSENKNAIAVQFALGTNTSLRGQDALHLAQVDLPSTLAPDFSQFAVGDSIPIPLRSDESDSYKVIKLWKHPGEINRVKVSPKGDKILTFDNRGVVHLFNVKDDEGVEFSLHASEGYCLEWVSDTEFLSGANDGRIALWDVKTTAAPTKSFLSHSAVINDISYSKPAKVLFGSVSDDFTTQIHDLRAPEDSPAIKITEKHIQNAIQFHPHVASLFATGGKDNVVNLYDARNTKEPMRVLFGHNDSVVGLAWDNTTEPQYLYSWGLDKRVLTWDLDNMTEEYTYPTAELGEGKRRTKQVEDPCLRFIHGGHTNRINDFAVHPVIPSLFATVGDDTLLEIFKPKTLVEDSGEGESAEEEEPEKEAEDEKKKPEEDDEEDEDEAEDEKEDVDMRE